MRHDRYLHSGRTAQDRTGAVHVLRPVGIGVDVRQDSPPVTVNGNPVRAQADAESGRDSLAGLRGLRRLGDRDVDSVEKDARETTVTGQRPGRTVPGSRDYGLRPLAHGYAPHGRGGGYRSWPCCVGTSTADAAHAHDQQRRSALVRATGVVMVLIGLAGCATDPDQIPDLEYATVEASNV